VIQQPKRGGAGLAIQSKGVKLKVLPNGAEQDVTLPAFKLLTKKGIVVPTSLVSDPELTAGEWRTADNLRAFRRYSPQSYPEGPYLAGQRDKFRPTEEQVRRSRVGLDAYEKGDLIERCYDLVPFDRLGPRASRFMILPSFHPERVITLSFGPEGLHVEAAMNTRTSIWYSIPQVCFDSKGAPVEPLPFDPASIVRKSTPLKEAGAFLDWEKFSKLAASAGDAHTPCCDGIGYRHRAALAQGQIDARWSNPTPAEHPRQWELLHAYLRLLEAANLSEFGVPEGYQR
jgi:hypothetical protein